MSVLRSLENRIAGLVEGAFGRAFRSELRPVEIARKLAREMDEHKVVSVSKTYAPNEYHVYVSSEDRERFDITRARWSRSSPGTCWSTRVWRSSPCSHDPTSRSTPTSACL